MNDLLDRYESTLTTLTKSAEQLRGSGRPAMHKAAANLAIVAELLKGLKPEIEDLAARRFSQNLGKSASLPWWADTDGRLRVERPPVGDDELGI